MLVQLQFYSWVFLPCLICSFKTSRLLKLHRRTHTDLQYDCNQCDKSFRSTQSLKRHLEYHTGTINKPFVCDVCGKGFRLNVNLVEHRRIHTGEKPFSCEHCTSNFRTGSSFYAHMRKIHGLLIGIAVFWLGFCSFLIPFSL